MAPDRLPATRLKFQKNIRIRPEDNCRVNSRHTVISSPLTPLTTGRLRLSRRDSPHLVYPFHLKQFCYFAKLWV